MRFSHIVVTVFAGLITQGNIATALPSEGFDNGHTYVGGESARPGVETREVTEDKDLVIHERAALEGGIFPQIPFVNELTKSDMAWIGLICGCTSCFLKKSGIVGYIKKKLPQGVKDDNWIRDISGCIATSWNAVVKKDKHKVKEEDVEKGVKKTVGAVTTGVEIASGGLVTAAEGAGIPVPDNVVRTDE